MKRYRLAVPFLQAAPLLSACAIIPPTASPTHPVAMSEAEVRDMTFARCHARTDMAGDGIRVCVDQSGQADNGGVYTVA